MNFSINHLSCGDEVSKDAVAIKSIKRPQVVKEFIQQKIQDARKEDFIGYKPEIIKKLASMKVNSVFELFELLRKVEELFGEDYHSNINIELNLSISLSLLIPAAPSREDGPWAEPPGAAEGQQSEGV